MTKYKLNLEPIEVDVKTNSLTYTLVNLGILIPVTEPEWPQLGNDYFYVSTQTAHILRYAFADDKGDKFNKATGNMFRTHKEAEAYRDSLLNQK